MERLLLSHERKKFPHKGSSINYPRKTCLHQIIWTSIFLFGLSVVIFSQLILNFFLNSLALPLQKSIYKPHFLNS